MKLKWDVLDGDKQIKVELVYNVYLGIKKLYVNGREVLSLKKHDKNRNIVFKYDGKEYKMELAAEGYGYEGHIITPEGSTIYPEVKSAVHFRTPLWVIPFAFINIAIPVISVESTTPWIIAALASYLTIRISQKSGLKVYVKLGIASAISILAWIAYFVFYLLVRHYGIKGGFITFPPQ